MRNENSLLVSFSAGDIGQWRIERIDPVIGESLALASRLLVEESGKSRAGVWTLCGVTSNARYATAAETVALRQRQGGLGRLQATHAALIPIRKSAAWWNLAQDERRAIFEEQSRHIRIGLEYLPAIARRLHHCRDLPGSEPFDFLTWFEYAPEHANDFETLVQRLRDTLEWRYVEREADIRLVRG